MAENPSNIVPDNLIVIEGGKQLVPAPAPSDAGKVLGVVNASGGIGWVEDQGGTLTQVQADWAETDPSKVSFIDNKPTIPSKTSDLQNDSGFITSSDIPAIPTKTSDLQNDSGFITSSDVPTKTSELQNDSGFITSADVPAQVQANWNETSTGAASYIQNKPSIPSKTSDLQNDSGFITSSDIPAIPTKTSDLQNDSGFITSSDIPAQVQSDWNETNTSSAAYIQNKPTIPPGVIVDQTYNASSTNAQSGTAVAEAIAAIPVAPTYSEGDGIDITNNVISADVDGTTIGIDSTTHKIKSLQTIPTKTSDLQNDSGFITSSAIPTVNDATLTIQKNGSTVDTFTANSSTNKTVNIAVPTKTSDLQNDSGFITSSDIPAQVQANWNESDSSSAAYIQNKPTIPTVDQTYNASSTNAQSGVAVASAVAGVNAVPASTSSDENKVLTVNSSGTPVWAASSVPASKPLVQGNGITITDGQNDVTISANADQNYSASSTNAQSGIAVASAIAGIRQVPASTSADEDKVLTVNSSGMPVWAAAQGGGGGDSEFPYDPGYMHTGWNKMVVRFGDTSYDPTNKTSASSFTSIVALNEPGVYEYTFNLSSSHSSQLFKNEWNDITNNPVDILQLTSNDQLTGSYYGALFMECTGLRSVWNIRGYFGSMQAWFRMCTNLEVVSGHIPERIAALNQDNPNFDSYGIKIIYGSGYVFYKCIALKKAETLISFTSEASSNVVASFFEDCIALKVGAPVLGYVSNATNAYKNCVKLVRLYGLSDLEGLYPSICAEYNPPYANYTTHTCNVDSMFCNCYNLSDLNGLELNYGKLNKVYCTFTSCESIEKLPVLNIDDNTNCSYAFNCCYALKEVPIMPYDKVLNAEGMFGSCRSITDVTGLTGLATLCTNVYSLLQDCWWVVKGALELYTALQASSTIATYSSAFTRTGVNGWNDQRSQIPSSWGGTGA